MYDFDKAIRELEANAKRWQEKANAYWGTSEMIQRGVDELKDGIDLLRSKLKEAEHWNPFFSTVFG